MKEKKVLCIGGAAFASVFTAGMLVELETQDKIKEFDYIVGSSSGSISACFVAARATKAGADGFWRRLSHFHRESEDKSLKNLLFGKSIFDVRYLVDTWLTIHNPIPWQKVIDSDWNKKGKLLIQVMDVDTGRSFFCSHFTDVKALKDAIAASCSIPFLASIRPFKMKNASFKHMKTRDHEGEYFEKKTPRCFDGDMGDMYFRDLRSWVKGDSYCVLTTSDPDHTNKCFPFGEKLWWLEFLVSCSICVPHFKATYHYQRERIFDRGKSEFKKLFAQSKKTPSKYQLVMLPKDMTFQLKDALDKKVMKKYLRMGNALMKPWIRHV